MTGVVGWIFGALIGFAALVISIFAVFGFIALASFVRTQAAVWISGIVLLLIAAALGMEHLATDEEKLNTAVEKSANAICREKLRSFDLSSDLFRVVPSDFDYLSRGHRIDREKGSVVRMRGGDPFHILQIIVSSIEESGDGEPVATLEIQGIVDTNRLTPERIELNLKEGELRTFQFVPTYEFFVFIEEEHYSYFVIALARRKIREGEAGV